MDGDLLLIKFEKHLKTAELALNKNPNIICEFTVLRCTTQVKRTGVDNLPSRVLRNFFNATFWKGALFCNTKQYKVPNM